MFETRKMFVVLPFSWCWNPKKFKFVFWLYFDILFVFSRTLKPEICRRKSLKWFFELNAEGLIELVVFLSELIQLGNQERWDGNPENNSVLVAPKSVFNFFLNQNPLTRVTALHWIRFDEGLYNICKCLVKSKEVLKEIKRNYPAGTCYQTL